MRDFINAKVFISRHSGFKGSWLILWLSSLGVNVTWGSFGVPQDSSHFDAARLGALLQDRHLDIRDGTALREIVREDNPDFLFHFATQPLIKHSHVGPRPWDGEHPGSNAQVAQVLYGGAVELKVRRILVDMVATLVHQSHIRLLKTASEDGDIIFTLTTDEEISAN